MALGVRYQCLQSVHGDLSSELDAAQGYTVCLKRARKLCQKDELGPGILDGLGEMIWSYIDPLTASGPADNRLVRLSVEALLTFKTLLPSHPSGSATPSTSSGELTSSGDAVVSSAALIDTVVDVLLDDLTFPTSQYVKWKSRGRTFKACIIRILLWIWRNHSDRNLGYSKERRKLFTSSCRLWAPLEKEVEFSKTGSFDDEDKSLTPDDLKGVIEFAEWVKTETLNTTYVEGRRIKRTKTFTFTVRGADVGISRLFAHFDRRADWEYHLYDFRGGPAS
ncbi:hypothetical protein M407DRAFT_34443 [Tulasnella calospora MUT 4182]|uniref:Uncharacterized protein n=1 Tax=Tulasnella calospora MUT 4182 TaxID=1051891 RepID=A0A0C3L2I8_9AGAM|nr:hypothetical protein M407DRAFT_34443 [Tulasnella calospora MUT 4182]